MVKHHNGAWLRTEYNTAVLRAHQAADWQRFEADKDVLPNLRWVPSTSVTPGRDHLPFWGTVLPVDHPFWSHHRPGDRWNCKCSLEATDEDVTPVPDDEAGRISPPQKGLKSNPGKTAELFDRSHPYFPDSCTSCPFNSGVKNALRKLFVSRQRDCYHCPYINKCIDRNVGIEPIREAAREQKDYARVDGVMPRMGITQCCAVSTGQLNRTNMVKNTLLNHCYHDYDVKAAVHIWNHPEELTFVQISPLGEGKDLTSEKARANIEKKRRLGIIEYRLYRFTFEGRSFDVKLAVHKKGYEQFYSLHET